MNKSPLIFALFSLLLASCTPDLGQNLYTDKYTGVEKEIGHATEMEFATVIRAKEITIYRKPSRQSVGVDEITGLGVGVGAVAGGLIGVTIGNGIGEIASIASGAIIGSTAGEIAEQKLDKHKGYEYLIITEHKKLNHIIQYDNSEDVVFKKGDKVILATYLTHEKRITETQNKGDQFYDKFEKEIHEEETDQEKAAGEITYKEGGFTIKQKYWKYQRLIPANDIFDEVKNLKSGL